MSEAARAHHKSAPARQGARDHRLATLILLRAIFLIRIAVHLTVAVIILLLTRVVRLIRIFLILAPRVVLRLRIGILCHAIRLGGCRQKRR